MIFVGSYMHALDAKKRVFIPAKFREDLGSEFYITRKFNRYLSIYTAEDWEEYVTKIADLPETIAEEVQDFILGAAQKCVPDANGRIVLDEHLMRHAGIQKNIMFVGTGHQIRVFAEDVWQQREEARAQRNYSDLRAIMSEYKL